MCQVHRENGSRLLSSKRKSFIDFNDFCGVDGKWNQIDFHLRDTFEDRLSIHLGSRANILINIHSERLTNSTIRSVFEFETLVQQIKQWPKQASISFTNETQHIIIHELPLSQYVVTLNIGVQMSFNPLKRALKRITENHPFMNETIFSQEQLRVSGLYPVFCVEVVTNSTKILETLQLGGCKETLCLQILYSIFSFVK